jgi:hypothetical protein
MIEIACHCGAARLELARAPRRLTGCNCSICRRYGALWAYYRRDAVRLRYRRRDVEAYAWGDRRLRFVRCRTCGCVLHHEPLRKDPTRKLGVNMRLADPAAIAGIRVRRLDGARSWKFLD